LALAFGGSRKYSIALLLQITCEHMGIVG